MPKVFWVHPESDSGGLAEGAAIDTAHCEIVTMREYVKCWRSGYVMEWQPPQWIQDIFPPAE